MKSGNTPSNPGAVISVRGSVVDVHFDTQLPSIHTVLRAGDEGAIIMEVLAQLDERHVRAISLSPTHELARYSTTEPLTAALSSAGTDARPNLMRGP